MGQLFSKKTQYRDSPHARWVRAGVACWMALCGALAQAGTLSVAASQAAGVLTLTVSDTAPGDMCSGGLCAADFTVVYDPATLEFLEAGTSSEFGALAFAMVAGQVLVSLVPDDPLPGTDVLFSLEFRALESAQFTLTVAPSFPDVPGTYTPGQAEIVLDVAGPAGTVPEPNTALLAALALAGMAWRRRTHFAHQKRPVPSF